MREYAKKILLPEGAVPKIKGHTRIELTKVSTGEKRVIEHDNTFQSTIIAKMLRAMGETNSSPWNNSTWASRPLWRNLCGGILLFRDEIQAPAEFMPAGNLMVANGSFGVENSGTPSEMGSYNSIESSTSGSNSLSLVFDWGTSQGNGTISCVCLTSDSGGYIGYGNDSGVAAATLRSIITNQQTPTANGANIYYNGKKYRVAALDLTNKKVTIGESLDGIENISIFQGQNETLTEYTYTGDILGVSGNIFTAAINDEEIAIISAVGNGISISNGSSGNILIFNVRTKTTRLQNITNTTGEAVVLVYQSSASLQKLLLVEDANGNYYLPSSTKLYKFSSAGVYDSAVSENIDLSAPIGRVTDEIIVTSNSSSGSTSKALFFYDGVDSRPTNGSINNNGRIDHVAGIDALCNKTSTNALLPYKNPLYLATINNLDSPITKDSTQTMKVIYTLTEVSA